MKISLQSRSLCSALVVFAAAIVLLCSTANTAEDRGAAANLALKKNARQSSTAFGGDAGRAVDGDTNGRYNGNSVSHTADEREPWWEVDLGRVEDIAELRIWNRTDEHGDRLVNFVVLISERPFFGSSLAAVLKEPGVWSGSHPGMAGEKTVIAANTKGRFVRVQLRQKNYLALAEVQVIAAQPVSAPGVVASGVGPNLALKKGTRQSSTGFGGDAQRAVDGDTNGDFARNSVSHTNQEKEPWWEVDLGRMEDIAEIRLWNRTDQHSQRLANYYVFVSEWPFFNNSLEAARQIPAIWNSFYPGAVGQSASIKVGAKGRFVRVQLRDTNFLSLAEVEVLGARRPAEIAAQPALSPPAPAPAPAQAPTPAPTEVYAPVPAAAPPPTPASTQPPAPIAVTPPAAPAADFKRDLGAESVKRLGDNEARENELLRTRQEQEKAEVARKMAEAIAAETARNEAARQEAAKKAAADEAARQARQKAASEPVRVKIPEAVPDSKWDGTAEYACTEFWVYLATPVQFDSVGHARPADDWHKTVGETMELKMSDKEKKGGEYFQIRGTSFEHEFKRERDWYGATGHYRLSGTLNPDMTVIKSLTVSYRVDPIRVKNSQGQLEREKDKSWSATIANIARSGDSDRDEYSFALKLDMEKLQLPAGSSVSQCEFVESDTYYVYSLVRSSDEQKTLTETIRTTAGPWKMPQPGSNVDIDITIKKRKGR